MPATQTGRPLLVKTPLGADALLLQTLSGHDGLSQLFSYRLELLSEQTKPADFSLLLGQGVTITIQQGKTPTYLNGIVSRFAQQGDVAGQDKKYHRYVAEVVPKLWLYTRSQNTRIFAQLNVPDIVKQVLQGLKIEWKLTGSYPKREYCVQYQETDFAFVSRLLEEEGIWYCFTHKDGEHTMVIGNSPDPHAALANPLVYREEKHAMEFEDSIFYWEKNQEIRSGKFSLREHQFEVTGNTYDANYPILASVAVGTVTHKQGLAANASLEIYEYPGRFGHHYDNVAPGGGEQAMPADLNKDPARLARLRMEQEALPGILIRGQCTNPALRAGMTFTLSKHPHGDGPYVATRVEHFLTLGDSYRTSDGGTGEKYVARIECIPKALAFRPPRVTPRPIIHGTQTATVVASQGNQKIVTDKYGRVKIMFPWDKESKQSCWVRLATLWSDQMWGSQFIPRDGQEVVVTYENGDPDKPLIVGCVYNNKNMPPFALPDNATQSGIKTYCGAQDKFNLLRFEDKTDNEEIWLHAQKDYKREVLNNETTIVGVDGKAADGSQSITILKNRTVEVTKGDETFTIKEGSRTHKVHKDETVTIETGNRAVTISQGNDDLKVDKGNRTVTVAAGSDSLEAAQKITLKVGGCSIEITTSGITIKAPQISIQADSTAELKGGASATVDGGGALQLKGGTVKIN